MKFKLIVGNRRFQVDEISEVELIYYGCNYINYIPNISNFRVFAMPKVSDEISAILKLESMTKNTPDIDPLTAATFNMSESILRGIRFQVPAKYFHSFKKVNGEHRYWKKVEYTDDFFICSCRNVLVLRDALMLDAGRVDNEAVELTFRFEHYETFPIQLLDKVIERSYKKKET